MSAISPRSISPETLVALPRLSGPHNEWQEAEIRLRLIADKDLEATIEKLGIPLTPAAAWMGELVRGPAAKPDAEDEARRAVELSIARAHGMG